MNEKTFFDELMENGVYHDKDGVPILQESLFSPKKTEISFTGFSKDFKRTLTELTNKISTSLFKNTLTLYKSTYPALYILTNNDYRMRCISDVSTGFYLDDVAHTTGISVNTLANNLIEIINSVSDSSDYCDVRAVYTGNSASDDKLQLRIYSKDAYCFRDIMTGRKQKSIQITYTQAKSLIDGKVLEVIGAIKGHTLGKMIPLSKDNAEYYSFNNGVIRSISSDFDKRTFERVYPGLTTFSACMNLAYLLDESILMGTNLMVAPLSRGGIFQLYIGTKPNVTCK